MPALIYLFAGLTIAGGGAAITLGTLVAFTTLQTRLFFPIQSLLSVGVDVQSSLALFERVFEYLELPVEIAERDGAIALDPAAVRGAVAFEQVAFRYAPDGEWTLRDIDLEIPPGTTLAVVGETGSGKTTFAKLLTRLMDPVEGRVLVDDVDLRELSFASLRSRIVMVPQDGFLFEGSILDNVRFGLPSAADEDVELAMTELGLMDWLAGLPHGLATDVGQRGEQLSAGERQLVALARAYLADPDLLVLDEATSAIDPATEVRLARALEGLTRGRTALTIAHRLSTAEAADDVLVFDAGRVVERGRHADLVDAGGVYSRLHESWAAQQRA
jgi:ATP-binding cassette, subfamily B, bacterial